MHYQHIARITAALPLRLLGPQAPIRLESNDGSVPPFPKDKGRPGMAQGAMEQDAGSLKLILKRHRGNRSQGSNEVKNVNSITRVP